MNNSFDYDEEPGTVKEKLLDIENNAFVRLGVVITIILFVIAATATIVNYANNMTAKLDINTREMAGLRSEINNLRTDLNSNSNDRFTKAEARQLCKRNELINPGWKCGWIE